MIRLLRRNEPFFEHCLSPLQIRTKFPSSFKRVQANLYAHNQRNFIVCSLAARASAINNFNHLDQEPGEKNSEYALRLQFDLPQDATKSKNFHTPSLFTSEKSSTGLFMDSRFQTPAAFISAASTTIQQSNELVNMILESESLEERLGVIKLFDQLSDTLCQVMDAAEVVRQVHADKGWQNAAEQVYSIMLEYMNGLNTHIGLYTKIRSLMLDPTVVSLLSGIERQVGKLFLEDFEKSGIHLGSTGHSSFVELNNKINNLGREFMNGQSKSMWDIVDASPIRIPISKLQGLEAQILNMVLQQSQTYKDGSTDMVNVVVSQYTGQHILRDCEDEQLRKDVYIVLNQTDPKLVSNLEDILQSRYKIANLVGFPSYSALALKDKMAKSPQNVSSFLMSLSGMEASRWGSFVEALLQDQSQLKGSRSESSNHTTLLSQKKLKLWNRDYLISRFHSANLVSINLRPYFSLGRVITGISKLLTSLFGVYLESVDPQPGEIWDPNVKKLEARDENRNLLGIIYCDLHERYGKSSVGAAHFTIKCSRRIDKDFIPNYSGKPSTLLTGHRNNKEYQLPIVALVTSFKPPKDTSPTLLNLHEVETLFHEMGHAIHSMLGQTDYQNISGTRCPLDFVEFPSILMETFASSFTVLNTFARHYENGSKLNNSILSKHLEMKSKMSPYDVHSQIFMSALDLNLHDQLSSSSTPTTTTAAATLPAGSFANGFSVDILKKLHTDSTFGSADQSTFPYVDGTSWHTQFTHLLGYGSCYYSYLFDRVLAGVVYKNLFSPILNSYESRSDSNTSTTFTNLRSRLPVSDIRAANSSPSSSFLGEDFRAAGDAYRAEILFWGGGRDPWISLAKLFDKHSIDKNHKTPEILSTGSRQAMNLVGSWGLQS